MALGSHSQSVNICGTALAKVRNDECGPFMSAHAGADLYPHKEIPMVSFGVILILFGLYVLGVSLSRKEF